MKPTLIAVAGALLLAGPARAGENAGVTAAPVLQLPMGARAAGMGTAFTAVADDVSTLHYNPGGLANLNSHEATLMVLGGQQDNNVQYLAGGTPLPFAGFTGSGYATLAASVLLSRNGDIEVNTLNPDGSPGTSSKMSAGGDTVVSLGYAERLADTPFELPDSTRHIDHFLGFSGKYIHSALAQSYSAHAYAADVGYFGRCPELGVTVGASVLNLGSPMRFVEEGDPLPLTTRAGGAWSVPMPMPESNALVWAADWEYQYYERLWFVNTGVEYTFLKQFSARVGYQAHHETPIVTLGFGARLGHFSLDYGWTMNSQLGDAHRFSVTFRFGAVPVREREKARRPRIESMPEREEIKELEQEQPSTYDQPRRPPQTSPERKGVPGWIY